jgi:hypothetical protein
MSASQKVAPTDPPPARRSSFHVVISDLAQQAGPAVTTVLPARQLSTQTSTVKDYRRFEMPEERVTACMRTYKREILSVHGTRDSTLAFNEHMIDDFMERQKASGLSESDVMLVYRRIAFSQVVEKAEFNPYRILSLFIKTMMGYVDLGTDLAAMAYYTEKNPLIAAVQGGILVFSFFMQCIFSIVFGQPLWVGLLGLVGMKPALEAWRDATGAGPYEGQKMANDQMLGICRMVEMVVSIGGGARALVASLLLLTHGLPFAFLLQQTETIPQALVQVVALLLTDTSDRTSIQFVSLAISLLTAGSTIAFTDRSLDKDKSRRKVDPHLFGYVPSFQNGQYRQLASMVVFFSTYVGAKMFSLSVLVSRGGITVAGVWLLVEFAVLLGVRMGLGNWRLYRRGADGAGFGLLVHLGFYIALLSAPFPLLRNPTFLTSRVYSGGLLYMLMVNFVLVGITYRYYDQGTVDERTAWGVLSTMTAVCIVAGAVAYRYVPRSHRKTFYEHLTFKRYVETFWWNDALYEDSKGRELDIDGGRAILPVWLSSHYLPMERCKAFYAENWARWEEEQPEWFDEEFKIALPSEFSRERNPNIAMKN